tara:strand:+ start:10195 stop:11535 length:1341 start_codon:yes stop_codon:yes gene_type:complete
MKKIKLLLLTLPLLFGGCGQAEDLAQLEPTLVSSYKKPTFEPMNLEQYKEAYPELLGLSCGIEKFFDTYINVFGVTVAAMPNTPVPETIHAAKIFAQLIDNDEDFIPDDPKIFNFHQKDSDGRNCLVVLVDTKALDNEWIAFKPGQRFWVPAQALRPGHSGVGHSRDGEMDIAVEELFHKYSKALQRVYPRDFGLPDEEAGDKWSSTLSNAMDLARGIDRTVRPVNGQWIYPENAWYTYSATSCGWGCQIDEYLWHVWATNIGYNEILTRQPDGPKEEARPRGWCDNLSREWKPCTRKDLKEMDLPAYQLINKKEYRIPTNIPFGEYGNNRVEYHGYEIDVRFNNGHYFTINRNSNTSLTLKRGNTYYFDQSLNANAGYELRFSATRDGVHGGGKEYQKGVKFKGVPGNRGSHVKITVANDAPDKLYLYCKSKLSMVGKSVLVIED